MRLLVLTSEPISADGLRSALPGGVDAQEAEVLVVAPALQESGLRFWMSDADEAIARAEEVGRQSVEALGEQGVPASGDTGESDPVQAIQDALQSFPADRIILFTRSGDERSFREDIDVADIEARFGIPVTNADL
jgi:hypothetical protein